jgi:hypothetical protein
VPYEIQSYRNAPIAFGLFRPRVCVLPTWRGWLLLLLLLGGAAMAVLMGIHPFLVVHDPRPGGALVIEGWASDYAMEAAAREFETGRYHGLYVTGGPLEKGAPLSEYGTVAELGAATIQKLRPSLTGLHAVPAPKVRSDRTYASAIALKKWLEANGKPKDKLNLVTGDTHSRRSRMLFQEAFGPQTEIGVIAIEDRSYDPDRWWTSSQGFRSVTNELIAYLYATLFFRPE